jgi:predicted transcriptional regulator
MLKRHLRTDHHSSVEEYRHRWSLPASYPMVAADYAARRSALAVKVGLGRKQVLSLTQPPLHGRASKGN